MAKKARRTKITGQSQTTQEKKKLQIGLVVLLVAAVLLGAIFFSSAARSSAGLPATVSTARGYELYQQDDVFVLDVREQYEWD